jgi:thioredoxin 1
MSNERLTMTITGYLRRAALLIAMSAVMLGGQRILAQTSATEQTTGFAALDQWKAAVIAGDAAGLKAMYSTDPAAQVMANGVTTSADADANFWLGLKAQSIKMDIVRMKERPAGMSIIFKAEVTLPNGRIMRVTDGQGWRQQGTQWRLAGVERADEPHLTQPSDMNKDLYPADADARAEIKEAEEKAAREHKRVLLVFGANWCFDCHVLDLAFHRPDFAATMAGYEVVHVDIGPDGKKNGDLAQQYDTPLDKGVPVLAVLERSGKVVVSQKNGEFEDARSMTPESLLEFLNKWKPETR